MPPALRKSAMNLLPPPAPARFEAAPPQVLVANIPVIALARFRRLMAYEGWPVDLARMCCDRIYVYERLAQAHTSASPRLRNAALSLFAAYASDEGVLLH